MNWVFAAPLFGGVAFMLIFAATILLWPASRRLGHLIELTIQEKSRLPPPRPDELHDVLQRIEDRLQSLEEGQRFARALAAPSPRFPAELEPPAGG